MSSSRKVRLNGLSEYLNGVSRHTIRYLVRTGKIPYQKFGKTLFFDLDEIDAWMKRSAKRREV